jgi:spore maturation protein CgeB
LDHETEREKIAHAGFIRAELDHTWKQRFKNLLDFILEE